MLLNQFFVFLLYSEDFTLEKIAITVLNLAKTAAELFQDLADQDGSRPARCRCRFPIVFLIAVDRGKLMICVTAGYPPSLTFMAAEGRLQYVRQCPNKQHWSHIASDFPPQFL
jgi:hypothetical protein